MGGIMMKKDKPNDTIKKPYEKPILEVVTFDTETSIASSGTGGAWDWLEHEN